MTTEQPVASEHLLLEVNDLIDYSEASTPEETKPKAQPEAQEPQPPNLKIHPVIHVSHLKTYVDGSEQFSDQPQYQEPPLPQVIEDEPYYSIEAFRKHKRVGKKLHFLVKWKGYGEDENTWRSETQLRADMTPDA